MMIAILIHSEGTIGSNFFFWGGGGGGVQQWPTMVATGDGELIRVWFRRGSLRNGYHIQGRQQACKLPNPDLGGGGGGGIELFHPFPTP